jgi:zinc transport system substrate-binding protein
MRFFLLLFCLWCISVQAAPRVVTSIAPVHEITSSIMAGVAVPDLIVSSNASTHHFTFKPSHMRLLQRADLVIWIDRHFESGFNRLPDILPRSTIQLELLPRLAPDLRDGHIWYSPQLTERAIALILVSLIQLDPENQPRYSSNADKLIASLRNWRQKTKHQLDAETPGFITDHEFLGQFTHDFDLDPVISAHDQHDDHGGLSDLDRIETYIRETGVRCLITAEPEPSKLAVNLSDKYDMKIFNIVPPVDTSELDTSEIDTISIGKGILRRLEQLTNALAKCRTSS